MANNENGTARDQLLAAVGELRAQADVIERAGDQQAFEDALADVEGAVKRLRAL